MYSTTMDFRSASVTTKWNGSGVPKAFSISALRTTSSLGIAWRASADGGEIAKQVVGEIDAADGRVLFLGARRLELGEAGKEEDADGEAGLVHAIGSVGKAGGVDADKAIAVLPLSARLALAQEPT